MMNIERNSSVRHRRTITLGREYPWFLWNPPSDTIIFCRNVDLHILYQMKWKNVMPLF